MVSTRRQIISEQDRYGGYNAMPINKAVDLKQEVEAPREEIQYDRVVRIPDNQIQPNYSTRRDYPATAEFVGTVSAPIKKLGVRKQEDIMPVIRSKPKFVSESAPEKNAKQKVAGKTKAILALYMAIVVILSAIVIGTGLAISNANESVGQLENELAAKNAIILQQNKNLDELSDALMIENIAKEMGMVKAGEANEITLMPIVDPIKYESRTNWFDKFCDWIGMIFGN